MAEPAFNIQYLARLARIDLSATEREQIGPQLASILGYVEKLKQVDISQVEPTAHATPLTNVVRADELSGSLTHHEALSNAPAESTGLFSVPKIVE